MKQRKWNKIRRGFCTILFVICAGEIMSETVKPVVSNAMTEATEEIHASIKLKKNSTQSKIGITVSNIRELEEEESIRICVWNNTTGKEKRKWYTLAESDGVYKKTIGIVKHNNSVGKYYVEAYLKKETGEQLSIGKKTINIAGIEGGNVGFKNTDNSSGTSTVRISNIDTPATVTKVRVQVWSSADGKDDAKWYTAKKKGNYWTFEFSAANHEYQSGKYIFKTKVWDSRGVTGYLKEKSKTIHVNSNISMSVKADSTQSKYTVTVKNVRYSMPVEKVQVAVWSKNNGTDDKKWYTAKNKGDGTYSATVQISKHKDIGTYYAYTYVTLEGSSRKLVQKKTFNVKGITAKSVYYTYQNDEKGSVQVNIPGITSPAEIKSVEIRAYTTKNGKDDLVKNEAVNIGGIYKKNISIADHKYETGTYKIEVYITDARGIVKKVTGKNVQLKCSQAYKEKTSFAGIDVSKFQGNIDWNRVKAAGIDFVIIRVGYRGYTYGTIVEDPYFETNIKGALAAGIDVGVYFFSQAITEQEAKQEAQWTLQKIAPYKITYPVVIDTEYVSGGRANSMSASQRTNVMNAFCTEVKNGGYTPMIYASKSWLENNLIMSYLNQYDVWLARYASVPEYTGPFTIWQYSSKGYVDGISGYVDRNVGYKRYY